MQPIIKQKLPDNYIVYGFSSIYSTVDINYYKKYINVITIASSANEATDHLMTYQAAKLINNLNSRDKIIICSRDKSSSVLVTMLKQFDNYDVTHYTYVDTVNTVLNSL